MKIAEFVMNLSGKDGTKIEIELNPFVVTEEGNELVAPNGKSPQIIMFESRRSLLIMIFEEIFLTTIL